MIYITGDCHGDWGRFSSEAFPEQKEMTRDDYVIVCGDFGLWHDTKSEHWWLDWLEDKSFTLLFVDGNHENFDRLYHSDEFEVVDFYGGKAHKIRKNVYHLIRGHIFTLDDTKIFAFGGASSHDIDDGILDLDNFKSKKEFDETRVRMNLSGKMFRVNHESWWKEEMPSEEEMKFGFDNITDYDNKVDYIVSHCAPQSISSQISMGDYKPDKLTKYFDFIKDNNEYKKWFFGHYHTDKAIDAEHIALYYNIVRIA